MVWHYCDKLYVLMFFFMFYVFLCFKKNTHFLMFFVYNMYLKKQIFSKLNSKYNTFCITVSKRVLANALPHRLLGQ